MFKKLAFFLFLLLLGMSCPLTAKVEVYDEVISLGKDCQAAFQLRNYGLRKEAYPFDWLVTPIDGLGLFLGTHGAHFLDPDKLVYLNASGPYFHVWDSQFNFLIYHDFQTPDYMSDYEEVKVKYERRIARLFKLMNSNKRVLFVRCWITRAEAEYLDDLISCHFPKLNYTLLVLNNSKDFKSNWKKKRIRNFYLKPIPHNWEGDSVRWGEILSQFSVR